MMKRILIFPLLFSLSIAACNSVSIPEPDIMQEAAKSFTPQPITTEKEPTESKKISPTPIENNHEINNGIFLENTVDTVIDTRSNLIWAKDSAVSMSWEDSLIYCEDLIIMDKENWRMPTLIEIQDLFNDQDFEHMAGLFNLEKCTLWGFDENFDAGIFALCGINSLPEMDGGKALSRVLAVHDYE